MQHQINFQNQSLWHFSALALDAGISEEHEEEVMTLLAKIETVPSANKTISIQVKNLSGVCLVKKLINRTDIAAKNFIDIELKAITCSSNDLQIESGRQCSRNDCPIRKNNSDVCR